VDHAARGAEIAREMGLPEKLVHIIERHVGAGIPKDEAQELGLPQSNYIPQTLEEKIVAYADKLLSGRQEVGIEVTIKEFSKRLGDDHPSIQRLWDLDSEMKSLMDG
jgi:uncharacterized protein